MLTLKKSQFYKFLIILVLLICCVFVYFKFLDETGSLASSNKNQIASSRWTKKEVNKIQINETNELPILNNFNSPINSNNNSEFYRWDFWPLYSEDGKVTSLNNNLKLMFSLGTSKDLFPEERHNHAQIILYSHYDSKEWKHNGYLFPRNSALGSRQWTGTSIWHPENSTIDFYYTKAGKKEAKEVSFLQAIAKTSAKVKFKDQKLEFSEWEKHKVILEPNTNNKYYDSFEGFDEYGIVTAFRDPFYFQDPKSKNEYLIFTARDKTIGNKTFNGSIGLAKKTNKGWKLEKPLLISDKVSAELEVAQIFYRNNKYYLFFTSQATAFNKDFKAPTGFYGFIADELEGNYKPLNESGLIIASPKERPFQNHAFRIVDFTKDKLQIMSFVNYLGEGNPYELTKEWQKQNIVADLCPENYIVEITGNKTKYIRNIDQNTIN
ncbi:MAG: glycoside hydrolase family 68 protein [Candidatus Caenarcaniphilales bacterium]|nr:glycoside hydrolase family 68 protein [Candidatus Caenarcaniphilales bacterium]